MNRKGSPRPTRSAAGRKPSGAAAGAGDPDTSGMSAAEIRRLVHKLQVHQVELETQNEELRLAQAELAQSRDRFNDLYDFAPVGYLTIDPLGTIREANLTLVKLLGVERKRLVGSKFFRFVTRESQTVLYLHLQAVYASQQTQHCELTLRRADDSTFAAQLDSAAGQGASPGDTICRIAVSDISERRRAEELLSGSLREKEVLLREIHHRVKNNLQVVSSLVSLQTETQTDPAVRTLLGDVRDRVRSMALVHELLYSSDSLAVLDFAEYIRSLLGYLLRTHGEIAVDVKLTLAVQPLPLPVEAAVHCGLILNELVSNALKHAFPRRRGGQIFVALDREVPGGQVCLRVRDSGVGLPAGLDWRNTPSLGLRLVQMLARQLNGTVDALGPPGCEFRVKFTLSGDMLAP